MFYRTVKNSEGLPLAWVRFYNESMTFRVINQATNSGPGKCPYGSWVSKSLNCEEVSAKNTYFVGYIANNIMCIKSLF